MSAPTVRLAKIANSTICADTVNSFGSRSLFSEITKLLIRDKLQLLITVPTGCYLRQFDTRVFPIAFLAIIVIFFIIIVTILLLFLYADETFKQFVITCYFRLNATAFAVIDH